MLEESDGLRLGRVKESLEAGPYVNRKRYGRPRFLQLGPETVVERFQRVSGFRPSWRELPSPKTGQISEKTGGGRSVSYLIAEKE